VAYVFTLSADAAPEIARLERSTNSLTRSQASATLSNMRTQNSNDGWRQWNLAR